jgi:hypothetical protein
MVTTENVKEALNGGVPGLKILFEKLDKEDALKAIGILVILGVGKYIIDAVKDIVMDKK